MDLLERALDLATVFPEAVVQTATTTDGHSFGDQLALKIHDVIAASSRTKDFHARCGRN